jgi:hypothetical protein
LIKVASLHFVGAILGAMFTFSYWEFDFNWVLWFLFRYLFICFLVSFLSLRKLLLFARRPERHSELWEGRMILFNFCIFLTLKLI